MDRPYFEVLEELRARNRPPRTCAACRHFAYPAWNVARQFGHCTYHPPRPGSQGADRWPVMAFDESCGGFEASGTVAVFTPYEEATRELVGFRLGMG